MKIQNKIDLRDEFSRHYGQIWLLCALCTDEEPPALKYFSISALLKSSSETLFHPAELFLTVLKSIFQPILTEPNLNFTAVHKLAILALLYPAEKNVKYTEEIAHPSHGNTPCRILNFFDFGAGVVITPIFQQIRGNVPMLHEFSSTQTHLAVKNTVLKSSKIKQNIWCFS